MKEQILTLVKNPKFDNNGFKGLFDKEWKHNSKDNLRWLFYLTELQQWLRDIQGIDVEVYSLNSLSYGKMYGCLINIEGEKTIRLNDRLSYITILEEGLYEGLKLVK
jgi:hypothetical protein